MDKSEKKKIAKSILLPAILAVLMWVSFYLEEFGYVSFREWGLRPREGRGLVGIFSMPFLHGSLEHLFNNTVPLFVLGTALIYFYKEIAYKVLFFIMIMSGFWLWISAGSGTNHIGMSAVIYGLVAFLFLSGIVRKNTPLIAISMLMIFLYGSLIWGIFPIKEGVSWEGHLWGAISGFILAWHFKEEGPQRKIYQWELDEIEEERLYNERISAEGIDISNTSEEPLEIKYFFKENTGAQEGDVNEDT